MKHGPNDSVPESMFDDSINLVIWGHEHDQRIIPEDVAGKRYKITQPGSSVATSLTEGESVQKLVFSRIFHLITIYLRLSLGTWLYYGYKALATN